MRAPPDLEVPRIYTRWKRRRWWDPVREGHVEVMRYATLGIGDAVVEDVGGHDDHCRLPFDLRV